MGYVPPRPIKGGEPLCTTTLALELDELLKAGQALAGALTMPLHCTQSPTGTSVELGITSGLVLS